jgi:hypothetical protein
MKLARQRVGHGPLWNGEGENTKEKKGKNGKEVKGERKKRKFGKEKMEVRNKYCLIN